MPKQRITKEMVVDTAFELARSGGMEQMLVKNIAEKLGCSVQPIYSYCSSMDGLKQDVLERSAVFIRRYLAARIDRKDFFRSTGRAYIQLAKEEPYIFQIFALQQRNDIASLDDLYRTQATPEMAGIIAQDLGISTSQAQALHMNMLIYTMGIGTILAVTRPGIPEEEINTQLETAYQIFLAQICPN